MKGSFFIVLADRCVVPFALFEEYIITGKSNIITAIVLTENL